MILVDYRLRDFKNEFENKARKTNSETSKFKALKMELNNHLKKFNETLKVLPELKVFIENGVLCFSYIETTGTRTKFTLNWKISEFNEKEWLEFVDDFCAELATKESVDNFEKPQIEFAEKSTGNTYGLYFPESKKIMISIPFIQENKKKLVKEVLMHEIIHHFCHVNGLGARDIDNDFIELILKYGAYVSLANDAQQALHYYKITNGNATIAPDGFSLCNEGSKTTRIKNSIDFGA